MFMPTEITRDSDTKVGMGIYHIQSMAFNGRRIEDYDVDYALCAEEMTLS